MKVLEQYNFFYEDNGGRKAKPFAFRIPLKKYCNWELIVVKNYLHADLEWKLPTTGF
jgi:hypothetical protein